MGKTERKKIIKHLVNFGGIMILALIFSTMVEAGYNWKALRQPMDFIDISENPVSGTKGGYRYEFEEPTYVGKLKIVGEFKEESSYYVTLKYQNGFGVEKEEIFADYVYPSMEEAYTVIGKELTEIKVQTFGDVKDIECIGVFNLPEINKYRLIFFFCAAFLFLFLFTQREFIEKKPELFFGMYAFGFGAILILFIGPKYNTWDEEIHFRNVYAIASDRGIDWTDAAWEMYQKELPEFNTKAEKAMLKKDLDEKGEVFNHTEKRESMFLSYSVRGYLPMATVFFVGKKLGLSFSNAYMFGKLGNLLLYVLMCMLAIRIVKYRKMIFAMVAMIPTVVYQGSVYTYDNMVFACILLGFALWINEVSLGEKEINVKRVLAMILLFLFGCFSKAVYIPIILILLMMPKEKFPSRKGKYIFRIGVISLFLLMLGTFVLPTLNSVATGDLAFGADTRGGETSVVLQLISLLRHPVSAVKLFLKEIFAFDNFRNLGYAEVDQINVINLMCLNFASLGTLKEKWGLLLSALLVFTFFSVPEQEMEGIIPGKVKFKFGIILFMIVGLIWMALYLSFTVVGESGIDGVQARYYLPILTPLSYLTWNRRIKNCFSKGTYYRIVMGGMMLFMCQCVYSLALKPKLF